MKPQPSPHLQTPRSARRWWFPVALWALAATVMLVGMEFMCRVKAFLAIRDPYYLTMPFRLPSVQASASLATASPVPAPEPPPHVQPAALPIVQAALVPPPPAPIGDPPIETPPVVAAVAKQFLVVPPATPEPVNYQIAAQHLTAGVAQPTEAARGPQWYFKWEPGIYAAPAPYLYGQFRINSLGFRGKEFEPTKREGRVRIICVGGSSTFGNESPEDQTYPAHLERVLNDAGRVPVEVINAGFPAYTSFQLLNLVRYELMDYQPDLLLFYEGFNDLNPNLTTLNYAEQEQRQPAWIRRLHGMLYYRWSMLYTLGMEKLSVLLHDAADPVILYRLETRDTFLKNVDELIRLATSRQVPVCVVRQMILAPEEAFFHDIVSARDVRTLMRGRQKDPYGIRYPDERMIRRHAELMQGLEELCRRHEIPMWDVRKKFGQALRDGTQLFYDWVHLTPAANELLARAIAHHLIDELPGSNQKED